MNSKLLLGAIAGDIIGSRFEFNNIKSTEFELFSNASIFTDDTVMTVALADCILHGKTIAETFQLYGRKYPNAGYGGFFRKWLNSENPEPYNSFGNGSAMRVSPVGFAFHSENDILHNAKLSAEVTHNHPEGIKGAQAIALCIFMARTGNTKEEIKEYIEYKYGYDLSTTLDQIRPDYEFDETCQGTVPQAIRCFLESTDYESAIRLAISLGGDSDTLACITGGIAVAYYKEIPNYIIEKSQEILPKEFVRIIDEFEEKYKNKEKKNPTEIRKELADGTWVDKVDHTLQTPEENLTDMMIGFFSFAGLEDSQSDKIIEEVLEEAGENYFNHHSIATTLIYNKKYKKRGFEILLNAEKFIKTDEDRDMFDEAKTFILQSRFPPL